MQVRTQKEENINKMSSSIEEKVSNQIKYNSTNSYMTKVTYSFIEKTKKNEWDVAEELALEDGAEAEKEFTRLREKYSKYKRDLKKKEVSGTSSVAVQKTKKNCEELNYLSWLDKYTPPRKSKTNIEGEFAVSQIASQVEENGGEFPDEQNDDSYQNNKDNSQVNAHADDNEFKPSSLIKNTPKPNNAKEKVKEHLERTEKSNLQESIQTEETSETLSA